MIRHTVVTGADKLIRIENLKAFVLVGCYLADHDSVVKLKINLRE